MQCILTFFSSTDTIIIRVKDNPFLEHFESHFDLPVIVFPCIIEFESRSVVFSHWTDTAFIKVVDLSPLVKELDVI
jgi:hypothetical protein